MSSWCRFKREERVNLAISMSDVCIRVCADGVKDRESKLKRRRGGA